MERRWAPRKKIKLPFFFVKGPFGIKQRFEEEAVCQDINYKGVGFCSFSSVKKGEILKIFLPVRGTGKVYVPVFAEVVWVRQENNNYKGGSRFLV